MFTTTQNGDCLTERFASFGDFVAYADSNPNKQECDRRTDPEWSASASLEDAVHLARNGYTEIRPDVDSLLSTLQERITDRIGERFVVQHSVAGGAVDVGRYLSGHPACMVQFTPEPAETMGRVVRIAVAGSVSWTIPAEKIRARGVAIVALVDTLHRLGLGVELWWDNTVSQRGTNNTYTSLVKVHDSAEPMDIDRIMFSLAHPSMLRRLAFSAKEQSPMARAIGAYAGGGYGIPHDMDSPKREPYDVCVERLQRGDEAIANDPFAWVMSTVSGLNVL